MAEQIASFIPAHIMYSTLTRKLTDDVLRSTRSINGLPTNDSFQTDFNRFKRDNEKLYKEMHDLAMEGFTDLTNKAELLTQGIRNMRNAMDAGVVAPSQPSDVVEFQERVKRNVYSVLGSMVGNAGETSTGSSVGGNAGSSRGDSSQANAPIEETEAADQSADLEGETGSDPNKTDRVCKFK